MNIYITSEPAEKLETLIINFKNFSMKLGYDTSFEAVYKCVGSDEHFAPKFVTERFSNCFIRDGYWKHNVNQNTDFMQRRVNMK